MANRHTPRVLGLDGRLKSKKEIEGLNKVNSGLLKGEKIIGSLGSEEHNFHFYGLGRKGWEVFFLLLQ